MNRIVFAIPGDINLPTGGYGYDRRLLAEWQATGIATRHLPLPGSFPFPCDAELALTRQLLLACAADETLLIDGLAYGAFPESLAAELKGRVIALVHHPLGLEAGLSPEQARDFIAREAAALRHAHAIVVTSPTTKRLLVADFGVDAQSITIAVPGVDAAPRATGGAPGGPLQLLAVGSLIPRKGYDILVEALRRIASTDWQLVIVGAADLAPKTAADLRDQIAAAGLRDRILLAGAMDQNALASAYARADLFVMPSLFEGYGMVLTEALARGLPIICTTGGAAAETVPDDAAFKLPPGDAEALAKALATLIDAPAKRARLAGAAWAAADTLPRWPATAAIVARACLADTGRKVMR